jgi:hypothetical protein
VFLEEEPILIDEMNGKEVFWETDTDNGGIMWKIMK